MNMFAVSRSDAKSTKKRHIHADLEPSTAYLLDAVDMHELDSAARAFCRGLKGEYRVLDAVGRQMPLDTLSGLQSLDCSSNQKVLSFALS